MGVGHVAMAAGATRFASRVNVGWLVFAAMFADFLLGILAMFGLEHANVPLDFATRHYLTFTFPYSHGLVAVLIWSALAGFVVSRLHGETRGTVFGVVAALVFSHFVLDASVHVVGLPLLDDNSPKIGIGLWDHLPFELALETVLAIIGVVIFFKVAGPNGPAMSRYGFALLIAIFAVMTWGQISLTEPPAARQLAAGWIVIPVVLSTLAYMLDRPRLRVSQ